THYTSTGAPTWLLSDVMMDTCGVYYAVLYSSQWVNGAPDRTVRGTMTLATTSSTTATLSWVLDGVAGSERIQHKEFGTWFFPSAPPLTGSYFSPAEDGWGQFFDV